MAASPVPLSRLDHYRLERRVAMGGMAEIFLATDERDGRRVAVKKILPQIANDQSFLERFFHEIRIQISLKHRNIVELLDYNPSPANAYIVMEYIDGGSLHALREDVGRLPWDLAVFAVSEALRGLSVAHRKGIVHRDIKPHNLMWKRDGTVKLADFGISQAEHLTRLTSTGMVVGTPAHMSPEQARGEMLDPRSDIFSIGTVLYELVTGINPFLTDQVTITLRRVVELEPEPPSLLDPTVPPSVDVVMRKLHTKSRNDRMASADEAVAELRGVLTREGIANPEELWVQFTQNPADFVAARRARIARESAERAESLLNDASASPEQALWEAYRTLACAPESSSAKQLFQTAAIRAGQRERPVDNAKIRELEDQLKHDPENVALLLQLAKLYRLEKDFINVMRFFRRLQTVAPRDAYTQGQIAALVGDVRGRAAGTASAPTAAPSARAQPAKAAPSTPEPARDGSSLGRFLLGASAFLLLVLGLWWAQRPRISFTEPRGADAEKVQALIEQMKKGHAAVDERPVVPRREDDGVTKILEKGALIEKEGGTAKAIAFYRDSLARLRRGDRPVVLLTLAELCTASGDRDGAMGALDEVVAAGGPGRTTALFKKADLLEEAHDDASAQRIYEDLSVSADPATERRARVNLAIVCERRGDTARALNLYEQVVTKAPESAESNSARLGAAALYRVAGRTDDARRLYEEVRDRSTPGSSLAKSAETGLKSLE